MSDEQDEGDFVYLSVDDALEIYAAIFDLTTVQAEDHLRSREALEGALGRSATYAHYEDADLALQAAVLAHGIAETQPFVDGNKREALIAMITFLELNGYALSASDSELASWIISFAAGSTSEDVAKSLRVRMTPVA
ncbi:MAG TPA: type II toxin-antitoxin system death-on-curing family toxin [Solirubrobacteraceae bacterium]|nr:type II toxin-antitoxin system death-on-curing family toxin [Solirubrobacteraceae bacterium]